MRTKAEILQDPNRNLIFLTLEVLVDLRDVLLLEIGSRAGWVTPSEKTLAQLQALLA